MSTRLSRRRQLSPRIERLDRRVHFADLTSGLTVTGIISDKTETDEYTFTVAAGKAMSVALGEVTVGIEPELELVDPNGTVVATDWGYEGAHVDFTATLSGTHVIRVREHGQTATGQYALTAFRAYGAQDADGDAGAATSGLTVNGNLTAGDLDVFTLSANAGESLAVCMTEQAADLDPEVVLYGPGGTQLASNDGLTGLTLDSIANTTGTYYIVARTKYNDATGNYGITIFKADGVQSADGDAGKVTSGKTVSGSFSAGDLDVFTFSASTGEGLLISISDDSSVLEPECTLYAPDGTQLSTDWGYEGATISHTATQNGGYFLVARDHDGDHMGNYGITIVCAKAAQSADGDAGALVSGKTRSASLVAGDLDAFTISANTGDGLVISVTESGTTIDPELHVYAPNGSLLSTDWDSKGLAMVLSATAAGKYTFVVGDYAANGVGGYGLTVFRASGSQDSDGDAGRLTASTVRTSSIANGDIDVHTIAAHVGDVLDFKVTTPSSNIDPSIALYGPDGARITNDDAYDSAEVSATANIGGTYRFIVYDGGADETGGYTLDYTTSAVADDYGELFNGIFIANGKSSADSISVTKLNSTTARLRVNGRNESYYLPEITRMEIYGAAGNDTIDFSGMSINGYVNAGDGDDVVTAGGGADTLTGGAGKNKLYGGNNNDRINGSGGRDSLYGQVGDDRIYGNGGADMLDGGGGVDRLWGGDGDDILIGGSGNDKLYAETGNDTLYGNAGSDILDGGAGTDRATSDGSDILESIEASA